MTESILKLCAHRALDGTTCKAPALRQADYCRHHLRVYRPAILPAYIFEANTNSELILAIYRANDDMICGRISDKLHGQILHEIAKRIRVLNPVLTGDGATLATSVGRL